MIRLQVLLDQSDVIRTLTMTGHAEYAEKGRDIVCSSVSAVVRTACRLIENTNEIPSAGGAGSEGRIEIRVISVPNDKREWLRGITDFLVCAVADIQFEYPGTVTLSIVRE